MPRTLGSVTVLMVLALGSVSTASAQAPATGGWTIVPSPSPRSFVNSLGGVVRFSATDAWAVGSDAKKGRHQTFGRTDPLVEHWDGSIWRVVATPHTRRWAALSAVAASSPTDIWAVGSRGAPNRTWRTLIEHYDGATWTIVPSPSSGELSYLTGVSASGPDDAWAVGQVTDLGNNAVATIAEHWDGVRWSVVPTPNTGSAYTFVNAVEQTSPDDAWLVGSYRVPQASRPLAEHWNGRRWKIVSPTKKGPQDELNSVSASSSTDVWAVGGSDSDPSGMIPLAYHWDGADWKQEPVPRPGNGIILLAVTTVSQTDAWAYGDYGARRARPAFEHWNGASWSLVAAPQPSGYSEVHAIVAWPHGAWAVGEYAPNIYRNNTRTLIESCCS